MHERLLIYNSKSGRVFHLHHTCGSAASDAGSMTYLFGWPGICTGININGNCPHRVDTAYRHHSTMSSDWKLQSSQYASTTPINRDDRTAPAMGYVPLMLLISCGPNNEIEGRPATAKGCVVGRSPALEDWRLHEYFLILLAALVKLKYNLISPRTLSYSSEWLVSF